jgi:hypothetical protein
MKKSISNLGKALNKAEQKQINGEGSDCFTPYLCYGALNPFVPCGTCEEYNQLPQDCKNKVINSCF